MPREDRLSQLPKHLRHCILSYLPLEDAIKTTLLSRSWRDYWISIPSMDLGLRFFNTITQNMPYDHVTEKYEYLDFVHQVLTKRRKSDNYTTLQRFKLFIPDEIINKRSQVNQWLDWAVNEFHVKELHFCFGKQLHGRYLYKLPVSILASGQSDIAQLHLQNCLLDSPVKTQWSTLTKLSLTRVMLNQEILDSITAKANCPRIEEPNFYQCHGQYDTLKASTLQILVFVSISDMDFKTAEIDSPNLQYFLYIAHERTQFPRVLGSGFEVNDLGTISKGLKDLHFVYNAGLTDNWLNRNLSHFSNLHSLFLCRCHNVKNLRISSTTLTNLLVTDCQGLVKSQIETPRLMFLSYKHFRFDIPNLTLSASSFKKAVAVITHYQRVNLWHEEFIRFLSNFEHSQSFVLEYCVLVSEYVMIPRHMKEKFSPPLYGVKHLTIKIGDSVSCGFVQSLVDLIDALPWLSLRPNNIC